MPYPNKAPDRPTVPEVAPLVRELYHSPEGSQGCCLHILLDDGNIDEDDADFCLARAVERQHPLCVRIATAVQQMTRTQRTKLYRMAY